MAGHKPRRDQVKVPCGTCIGCRADQGRQWAIRIMHESVTRPPAWFITLTYDDQHLPGNLPDDERVRGSLDPTDLQLFIKRLRKRSAVRLGYYAVGEYGDKSDRPHYHLALFGMRFLDKDKIGERRGYPVLVSRTLEELWKGGNSEITTLGWKSASYIAGYVHKKAREKSDPVKHLRVDPDTGEVFQVEKEFARMSRRPALGRKWLEKYWRDVYPRDFVVMDGSPLKPPRYYDRAMEDINPEIMEEVRYQRWKDAEEIGDEKLIMMEKVHRAKLKLFNNKVL
jgi:hypothetical protein